MTVPLGQALAQAREIKALKDELAPLREDILALMAERDHFKRESELGATMLGVIVSGLGLGTKATTKAGASVSDVLDLVSGLKADVKALAEALETLVSLHHAQCPSSDPPHLQGRGTTWRQCRASSCVMARAARDGVRRGRG